MCNEKHFDTAAWTTQEVSLRKILEQEFFSSFTTQEKSRQRIAKERVNKELIAALETLLNLGYELKQIHKHRKGKRIERNKTKEALFINAAQQCNKIIPIIGSSINLKEYINHWAERLNSAPVFFTNEEQTELSRIVRFSKVRKSNQSNEPVGCIEDKMAKFYERKKAILASLGAHGSLQEFKGFKDQMIELFKALPNKGWQNPPKNVSEEVEEIVTKALKTWGQILNEFPHITKTQQEDLDYIGGFWRKLSQDLPFAKPKSTLLRSKAA